MPYKTRLPAEWEPQSAIMLTWPHQYSDWQPWLAAADRNFAALATAISIKQKLIVACYDEAHQQHIKSILQNAGARLDRVRCYAVSSNDTWARDHGPVTVLKGDKPLLLDFRFNGWGNKFVYDLDDQITQRLHSLGTFGVTPLHSVPLILEGGGIESDGNGTLLTTRRCLLADNRNGLNQKELEQHLATHLGIKRFLWLSEGELLGDDTDGHIDTLARFCDAETIAYQSCADPTDPHFYALQAMARELETFRSASGQSYRLVALPLPKPILDAENHRLPAGYANFLIINGAVLVPTYADPNDQEALNLLQNCFPDREIIGIDCQTLIRQYGSLHCVTMQLPLDVVPDV